MTDSTNATKISFLGATVVNFSATLGFNGSPSQLSVTLVEDDGEAFGAYDNAVDNTQNANGNPGTYVDFTVPNSTFRFGGIIQSWKRREGINGNLVDVNIVDPRVLFGQIPIITNVTSFNSTNNGGVIDAMTYYNNDPVQADLNKKGMTWKNLRSVITGWTGSFYGRTYIINFDGFEDSPVSGLIDVPQNYRTETENPTLDSLLQKVSRDNGFDYVVESNAISPGSDTPVAVTIKSIRRGVQDSITDQEINDFLDARSDRVVSKEIGRELRNDASSINILGGKKRSLYGTHLQGSQTIYPIYNITPDGVPSDRIFVSLENIISHNFPGLISGLPFVDFETSILTTEAYPVVTGEAVPFPRYQKERPVTSRRGYMATEEILRAALFSKEAWTTALYYTFKDAETNSSRRVSYRTRNAYDANNQVGPSGSNSSTVEYTDNIANSMGIKRPAFNRDTPSSFYNDVIDDDGVIASGRDALIEACYQATLKAAETYYGKTFIVNLPESDIIDSIITNNSSYQYSQRGLDIEYSIADGSWAVASPDETVEESIPYLIDKNNTGNFKTTDGLIKPLVRWDFDDIGFEAFVDFPAARNDYAVTSPTEIENQLYSASGYYLNLDSFDTDSYLRIPKGGQGFISPYQNFELEHPTSGMYIYGQGFSVEQYEYDPRFALCNLQQPLDIGYGMYRAVVATGAATISGVVLTIPEYEQDEDQIGGTKEFMSWLYKDYFLLEDLNDADLQTITVNGTGQAVVNPETKSIWKQFYYSLLENQSYLHSDKIGFAPKRYTGSNMEFLLPLEWNYLRYGPFTGNVIYVGPTKVVEDSSLTPWNYSTYGRMNTAGGIMATNMSAGVNTMTDASFEIEGYPDINLGDQLGVNANLNSVSVRFGTQGITSTYRFRTFTGSPLLQNKVTLDDLKLVKAETSTLARDQFNIDKDTKQRLKEFKKNNVKVFDTLMGGMAGGKPQVGQGSSTLSNKQKRKSNSKHSENHDTSMNELFLPFTTDPKDTTTPSYQDDLDV